MNVSCPACRSVFRIDPAKVPVVGVRARCSVCGNVIDVGPEQPTRADVAELDTFVEAPSAGAAPRSSITEIESDAGERPLAAAAEPAVALASDDAGASTPSGTPVTDRTPALAGPAPVPDAASDASGARARPVNPYLNNTPELRARRLARALVSDLVAYNPQKREEGLRDGTLRQLFRDEIRKSWDEYVEQVGANVAESTPHFQDALNDVLAGGRRVF